MAGSDHLRGIGAAGWLAAAALGAAPVAPRAEPARTTWTTYLYEGPGPRYSVVDEFQPLTEVDVSSCVDGWCRVSINGKSGYMRGDVVARQDPAAQASDVLSQPAAALNRAAPPAIGCFEAVQTGANGGFKPTIFCHR